MLSLVLRPFQQLWQIVAANRTPRALAVGFTLGMIIGLMPKGNLLAVLVVASVPLLRANVPMALLGALAFSWFGMFFDPLMHRIGLHILTVQSLQGFYRFVDGLPLGPWIGFQNTVVTGSLLFGLYLAYPVYWLTWVVCRRLRTPQASLSRANRVMRIFTDASASSGEVAP
jgi:uncharacterized protein (TIGR03546 family)